MAYEREEVRLSQEIFYYLLEHHELREEEARELYRAYTESEPVQEMVKAQGRIAASRVKRYGDAVYLIPEPDNDFLGYTCAHLKKELCRSNATDKDYYLAQFAILVLLLEFYDGQGASCKIPSRNASGRARSLRRRSRRRRGSPIRICSKPTNRCAPTTAARASARQRRASSTASCAFCRHRGSSSMWSRMR